MEPRSPINPFPRSPSNIPPTPTATRGTAISPSRACSRICSMAAREYSIRKRLCGSDKEIVSVIQGSGWTISYENEVPPRSYYNETVPKAKDLESRFQRIEQQLRLFQKVSRFMVREMSLQEVLQGIVSLVVEYTECDSCLVYLCDSEELVLCASNTHHDAEIGRIRLKLNEGLTGWVARERRLLAISREAYRDPRFKYFGELPEDTFEAFLSSPVIARNKVVGVINVQHRQVHQHTGGEMEVLTTVGEQVGCVLLLARMTPATIAEANHVELVLSSGPIIPRN